MLKTNNIYKPGEPVYKKGIPSDEKKQGWLGTDKQGLSIDEH
jgi:hypothetical protein